MANTLRIKRRVSGAVGAPTSLANAELAFNEVDDVLYYGKGTGGSGGSATAIAAIAGSGAYLTLSTTQTVSGNKTFSGTVALGSSASASTPATSDNTTTVATTAYVKAQGYGPGSVTSVGLSLPSFITVSNSPVTGSGTLTGALADQTANTVFIAPNGSTGTPTFRLLVAADIPTLTAAKISDFDTQVRLSRLDQMAAPTGSVSFNSQRILDIAAPQLPGDAVNKQYADSIAQSLNVHGAADFATSAPVAYAYTSGGTLLTISTITGTDTITFSANHGLNINSQVRTGDTVTGTGLTANTTYYVTSEPALNQVKLSATFGGANATLTNGTGLSIGVTGDPGIGATLSGTPNSVDSGSTLTIGQRILVKDHTTAAYNGVYTVTTVGTGSNGVWTRATDFDNGPTGEITSGDYVFVAGGNTNGSNGFIQTASPPLRMGKAGAGYTTFTGDALSFTQFSGAGQITAGAGLTKSGNTLDVASTGNGALTISADSINLASGIATAGTYRSVTVDTYGRVTAGTAPTTFSGYGISDSSANLANAISDETGTGSLVFGISPSLTTPALAGETFSTAATVTAGTNAQGQSALTNDHNIVTTAAVNPSGVTLPTATVGRRILVVNRGANPVNVYPASGATIDALSVNVAISVPVNAMLLFFASSATQWYATNPLSGTLGLAYGGTGATDALGARTSLGLVIGTNVQAYDAELATLAGMASGTATALAGMTATTASALAALTATEAAIIDGSTAATATTLAATDRMVINDAGTMVQVALSDLVTFLEDGATSSFDIDGGTF
jgi:hypothetical protein